MTSEQALLANRLRLLDGATAQEAAIVLATVSEMAAWEHELRGPRGEWVTGTAFDAPGMVSARGIAHASFAKGMTTRYQGVTIRTNPVVSRDELMKMAQAVHAQNTAAMNAAMQDVQDRLARQVSEMAREALAAQQKLQQHQSEHERADTAQEKAEARKRRHVLAWHAGALTAGTILSVAEAKLGVPDVAVMASALGPAIGQEIIDFWKRLS